MQNLKHLEFFLKENYKNISVEINFMKNALIRPPCIFIEPVTLIKKEKNSNLKFKIHLIRKKEEYQNILDFDLQRDKLITNLIKQDDFTKYFEMLSETRKLDEITKDDCYCYIATSEFDAYVTEASHKNEEYSTMNTLKIGGI